MSKFPNIRALRLQNGYKQEFMADILGISQPEYSKIENGSRKIDPFVVHELCKLYDVKMEVLLRTAPVHMQAEFSALSEPKTQAYASQLAPEILTRMMDNYAKLVENYLKQQQTTERIMERLLAGRISE